MQYVANPRTSFAIVPVDTSVGPEKQRCLLIGQKTDDGSATSGTLVTDVPRDDASINALFGADSHLAMIARAYRSVNKRTRVDALPLDDNGSGVAATASVAFSGTATGSGRLTITVISAELHTYELDVAVGDTAATLATNLSAIIGADRNMPFTKAVSSGTITFTAANAGTHANDWLLALDGAVAGITTTLTGWHNGATNPSLTTLLDPVGAVRYQSIVWPSSYTTSTIKAFLNGRKNVNNAVMDGMAFMYANQAFSTLKSTALALNSSEFCIIANEPTSVSGRWIGPHVPEAPDCITAKIVAAFDRRLDPGASISDIVSTNAALDQYGGIHTHSLPLFNTPLLNTGMPLKGTGFTDDEQVELRDNGVSIIGANREWNAVITSVMVTTWQNDDAGNPDETWKYVEWRRTHGAIREYFQENCQKRFRQSRLTTGVAVPLYDIADEAIIRAYLLQLYLELTQWCLTVAGPEARASFMKNLSVILVPGQRLVQVAAKVPMVSQLGEIDGTIEYTFSTN